MADKEVTIKVGTDVELGEVQALEDNIKRMQKEKIMLDIQTNTERLKAIDSEIETVEAKLKTLKAKPDVDDSEILKAEKELEALNAEKINVAIAVEDSKLKAAEAEIEDLDGTEIDVDVNNISAMQSIEQIGQGFDRLKQGASELGQAMGTVLDAAGKQETNKTFLEMSVGADKAAEKLSEINSIVQQLPGDDTALQGLLSSAAAKNASLTADEMQRMGTAAADYFSAMDYYGKSATEAQQDMTNYLLAGNTAELERSPIMQAHIDKLKEASTVQERINALQEALNDEGWAGMSQQDTYNNKLQTFLGMIDRGKYQLGGMFQEGAKWGMDFVMQLDSASGGLVGMGLALASFASPLTDVVMGLGQIATGLNALKNAGDLIGLSEKLGKVKTAALNLANTIQTTLTSSFQSLKNGLISVGGAFKNAVVGIASFAKELAVTAASAIKNAVTSLASLAKGVLIAGANALKSAAMWAVEKAAVIASTVAEYGLAAAQAVLNFVMSLNPIMLVVIALAALVAALLWAYYNVDWFREMVDGAWQALVQFAQYVYGIVMGALQGLGDAFNNAGQTLQNAFTGAVEYVQGILQGLYEYIMTLGGLIPEGVNVTGNQVIDSIIAVMAFIGTLPVQLAMIFVNILASTLGFGNNFAQTMILTAMNSVTGFLRYIATLPGQLGAYLSQALSRVTSWAGSIVSNFLSAGSRSVSNFLGQIRQMLGGLQTELNNMLSAVSTWAATLPQKFWDAGVNAVKNFLNALGIGSPGTMQRTLVWEVSEMGRRVPIEGEKMIDNLSRLGTDAVDSFGNPRFGFDFDDFDKVANGSIDRVLNVVAGHGGGDIIINIEGDVDSEKRINQIVEVIRRELSWNNTTAGRSV